MGVDVEIKARPKSDGFTISMNELQEQFHESFPVDHEFPGRRYPDIVWDEYDPVPTVVVRTLDRYYGPGYERGHWPDIRKMADWVADALGEGAEVRYGGDTADDWEDLTPWPEARSQCDAHWERYGNEPYRAFFRRHRTDSDAR